MQDLIEIYLKSIGHLQQGTEMRFRFIKNYRSQFSVKRMCRVLKVSKSGFYSWLRRKPSALAIETACLQRRIAKLYEEHAGLIGSPMITADLQAEKPFQRVIR